MRGSHSGDFEGGIASMANTPAICGLNNKPVSGQRAFRCGFLGVALCVFAYLAACGSAFPCPATCAADEPGKTPQVTVMIGPKAPALERFAANELSELLRKLFDARVTIATEAPARADAEAEATTLILLGSPATNPAIAMAARSLPGGWPKLSDQGHLVRSVDSLPVNKPTTSPALAKHPLLLVGGGSPVATLWAVYEVGYHFGVRYLPTGDVVPAQRPAFKLAGIDRLLEPALRTRAWQTLGDHAVGAEAWSLAEQRSLIGQLAKMKFNRLVIETRAWQPFVDYSASGVRKQSAVLMHGQLYPVSGDTAGRAAFRGATLFENPDFAGRTTYAERLAAGRDLVAGLIQRAQELGMEAALLVRPLEFPREFAAALPGARVLDVPGQLAIGPSDQQSVGDAALRDIAVAQLSAYVQTYPALDALLLDVSGAETWKPSGSEGTAASIDFALKLAVEPTLTRRAGGGVRLVGLAGVDQAAADSLRTRSLPAGAVVLPSLGSSARRVAAASEWVGAAEQSLAGRSELSLPLGSSALGVVPQMQTGHLHRSIEAARKAGWRGIVARSWMAGDLAPGLHYLSRAAFDPRITPQAALTELVDSVSGEEVAPRLIKGFGLVEEATDLLDQSDAMFAEPRPDMLTKHLLARTAPPESWAKAKKNYASAMDEMYRGNTRARQGGRFFTLYFAKRFEFGLHYMTSVEALRNAGAANAAGDKAAGDKAGDGDEKRIAELEKALEALHSGLAAYADVARDPSDRGAIAVLNRHGYRVIGEALDAQ